VDLGEYYFICKDVQPWSSGFISMVWLLLLFLIWREFWWLYFFIAHLM